MDRVRQREIASKGGKAAHQKGTAHEWTSEEARDAGRKGGLASHRRRREQKSPDARLERAGRWGRRFRPPRRLTRPSARAIGLRSAPWHMIATGDGSRFRTRAPHSPAA